jgi:lysophospholipase L1-like esterase
MLLPRDKLMYAVQFTHPEKVFARLPGMGDETLAMAFGVSLSEYRAMRGEFSAAAIQAAQELLAEADTAARVARLPFPARSVVAALGDSVTDDLQSWFEILRHTIAIARPKDEIALVNAGVSGDTTTHSVARFIGVIATKPTAILCLIGTNDARLHGSSPTKTLVSASETRANLALLRNYGATQTTASWTWITVPGVAEDRITSHWFLSEMQVRFRNSDLNAVAEAIRGQSGPLIDINRSIPFASRPDYLLEDGLHPSLAGHKAIARMVIDSLTS